MKKSQWAARVIVGLALLYGLYRVYGFLMAQLALGQKNDWSPDQVTEQVMQAAFYVLGMLVGYFGVVWILDGIIGLFQPSIRGKCDSCGRPYRLGENFCPKCGIAFLTGEDKAVPIEVSQEAVAVEPTEADSKPGGAQKV